MEAAVERDSAAPVIGARIARAAAMLAAAGVDSARLDAELLLASACGCDRTALFLRADAPVLPAAAAAFEDLLRRRLGREPLAYITGRREFWSLEMQVTPDVLIPRPETERLVEAAIAAAQHAGTATPAICDLGTGSGCVAVAVARELPQARVWAIDRSPAALAVAAANAARHAVAGRLTFVESDLFAGLGGMRFDVIACNPPYVAADEWPALQPELRYEPRLALDGGADGLAAIRRVLDAAGAHLRAAGELVLEFGASQAAAVTALARAAGWRDVMVQPDYAGRPRVLRARR